MEAGPELDALVEEEVMGLQLHTVTGPDHPYFIEGVALRRRPRHYSTSIEAAWQVVERMHNDGFSWNLLAEHGQCEDQPFQAFIFNHDPDVLVGGGALTMPLAICLAALKAVEAEKGT